MSPFFGSVGRLPTYYTIAGPPPRKPPTTKTRSHAVVRGKRPRCYPLDFHAVHRALKEFHASINKVMWRLEHLVHKHPHLPDRLQRIRIRLYDIYSVEEKYAKVVAALDSLPEDGVLAPLHRGEYLFFRAVQNYFLSDRTSIVDIHRINQGMEPIGLVDDLNDNEEGPEHNGALYGHYKPSFLSETLRQIRLNMTILVVYRIEFDPANHACILETAIQAMANAFNTYKLRFLSDYFDLHCY